MENKKYFIGLDVGTDSVGYAVTYEDYTPVKYHGEPMIGVNIFEAANQCAERRGFRTARRRLNRKQNRIKLIQELFANEINTIDPDFFIRLRESHLFAEDKTCSNEYDFLRDELFDGKPYNKKYPTIHHLIYELMTDTNPHDVRLVYIACAWLVAHRGHFLNEVEKENIENILDFEPLYNNFAEHFSGELQMPWQCEPQKFADILKQKIHITAKEKLFSELLFGGKKPKAQFSEEVPYSIPGMIKLLSGGKIKMSDFFNKEEYSEMTSISLGMPEEEFATAMTELDTDSEILLKLKALYDWAILTDVLNGKKCISEAKISTYEQHEKDLANLKKFVKKYCKNKYDEIFRNISKADNYVAYSGHADKKADKSEMHNASKEKFKDYLSKTLKNIKCDKKDAVFYKDMIERLDTNSFLPKQVDGDNRVIPYQLYWYELKEILTHAENYLDFLKTTDSDGLSVSKKILSVFEFRVPYFVGPLKSDQQSQFAWMKRKCDGKIYPWNFDKMVNLDETEQEFIRRMTNSCTYIPGEFVLPKNSLLYTKFEVLNEINNIRVNGQPISVEQKQKIYSELFSIYAKITPARLRDFMLANGICDKESIISGVDMTMPLKSSLKVYMDFKALFTSNQLSAEDAEKFITHSTYSEDRYRFKKWITKEFPNLSEKDKKYLSNLKYKNFGRLSQMLLNGLNGVLKETGETGTIIDFLWNTNDNLMQLLSDRYTFADEIKKISEEYYSNNPHSLNDKLDEMYIPNAVKRPIFRSCEILNDIKTAMGYAPSKVFIEMARGANEEQKNKRSSSRIKQIRELYSQIESNDTKELLKQLENMGDSADTKLQSDALFLYFMQLGKCMYSEEPIDIELLKSSKYNIDHIYPQSYVKDDSILNNKVLVLSTYNSEKGDIYPIPSNWRQNMSGFWAILHENKLITDEKYKRLTRAHTFTDEEKIGFINRQLVETRQSTKALASIIKYKFPETDIVYVKAKLVSDFRRKYEITKCRSINDLHHAKDAYLNIAVGNVYNARFNHRHFNIKEKYSVNENVVFGTPCFLNGKEIWKGQESINKVISIVQKNNIHLTRYAFCRKGGLFDQQPIKASAGLVPRKKDLPSEKYGGYNQKTASFFVMVKYKTAKDTNIIIMAVDLMHSKKFLSDEVFATEYAKNTIKEIINKDVVEVSFPLGKRVLKINTVFSFDGYEVALGSKASKGKQLGLISLTSLKLDIKSEKYIKTLERFEEKRKQNNSLKFDSVYDKITKEQNCELYSLLLQKLESKPFCMMKGNQSETLKSGRKKFESLDTPEQIPVLLSIVSLLKTGRTGTADLTSIGGSKNAGTHKTDSKLSNWRSYSDVRITDYSTSGIFKKTSDNILKLL